MAPVTVTDRTAALVLGLEPRVFRELLVRLQIAHVVIGRRALVRVDDFLAALERARPREKDHPELAEEELGDNGELRSVDDVLAVLGLERVRQGHR